jgi:DNA-binding response OmpR family regulator
MSANSKHRILVVDDEPNIRVVLRAALEMAGYMVELACNGAKALELVDAGGIDLVVLDLNMPVLDGMTVLQRLADRTPPRPRVIVLTAHGSIPAAVKAVRLGASDFLQKPVLPEDFLLSVASVLDEPSPVPMPPDAHLSNVSEVLHAVRQDIWHKDLKHAEQLMNDIAEKAAADPAYFNLLGVIHEAEGDRRAAKTFYRKADTINGGCDAAKRNLQRLHEIETYGQTKGEVALGDEAELLKGMRGAVGQHNLDQIRRILEI